MLISVIFNNSMVTTNFLLIILKNTMWFWGDYWEIG